ncbi:putative acyl-CoA N-acyltransferase [Bradyrhizobium sp. ORS 285]|nr:putative acyl-CoA N-acyltransferase [Bradyrhizobium sp. ORS 285]
MTLTIISLRDRPDLIPRVFAPELDGLWPEFMRQDRTAMLYYGEAAFGHFADCAFAALDGGEVVGRAFAIPFAFGVDDRTTLPDAGWDEVIRWGHEDRMLGRRPTTMSALEIALLPKARVSGSSRAMLDALKGCARAKGFAELYAPVRPNQKHLVPRMPMRAYLERRRADGQHTDSWLRTHLAIGGEIVKIAPCSMTIVGTLAEWTQWTGVAFDRAGEIEIPGALVPVLVSAEHAVYVEPNVWIRHPV